jgi:hypothetical protein
MTMTSLTVTAEDARQYDGQDPGPVLAVAGDLADVSGPVPLITAADGKQYPVRPGDWVIRYGPGDMGTMSAAAHRRYFGDVAGC